MKTDQNTQNIVRLQEQIKYIKTGIDSIKSTLADLTNTLSSIRNDVDQANTRATNNKIEIERQKKEFVKLEKKVNINTKFRQNLKSNLSLIKWFASFIGFSNIVLIIVLLAQFMDFF